MERQYEELNNKIDKQYEQLNQKIDKLEEKLTGEIKTLDATVDGITKRLDFQEFINRGVVLGLIATILGVFANLWGWIGPPK